MEIMELPITKFKPLKSLKFGNLKSDFGMLFDGKMKFRDVLNSYMPAQNHIEMEVRDKDGNLKSRHVTHNIRTNVGASVIAIRMGSASGNPFNYIGLTTNSAAASTGDTTLTSELSASGLTRTLGTFTNAAPGTNSTSTQQGSYQLAVTWTYTGSTTQTINKVGIFDASSNGNMGFEAVITAATVSAAGDSISLTYTINF